MKLLLHIASRLVEAAALGYATLHGVLHLRTGAALGTTAGTVLACRALRE